MVGIPCFLSLQRQCPDGGTADAQDLKSWVPKGACGFKSRSGHGCARYDCREQQCGDVEFLAVSREKTVSDARFHGESDGEQMNVDYPLTAQVVYVYLFDRYHWGYFLEEEEVLSGLTGISRLVEFQSVLAR